MCLEGNEVVGDLEEAVEMAIWGVRGRLRLEEITEGAEPLGDEVLLIVILGGADMVDCLEGEGL